MKTEGSAKRKDGKEEGGGERNKKKEKKKKERQSEKCSAKGCERDGEASGSSTEARRREVVYAREMWKREKIE